MKLLIDVGNTAIKFALSDKNHFSYLGRMYCNLLDKESFLSLIKEVKDIDAVVVSSVVPKLNSKIIDLSYELLSINPFFIIPNGDVDFKIEIDDVNELGADLFADLVGGVNKYHDSFAIVDMGTATKILFVDKEQRFNSCAIFLGFESSRKILASSTALLPEVTSENIKPISECHNTIDVINSSTYYSQIDTIDGLINRYEKEVGYPLKRIFTGGNAAKFVKADDIYDDTLLLKGLEILAKRN